MNLNIHNNHPLIPRQQSYMVDTKYLTVHSDDRDICKWPNSNEFEILLPEAYTNVESMRLVEIAFPSNYYTFSNYNQNTKLSFRIIPQDPDDAYYDLFITFEVLHNYIITIQEGFYTPAQLALEIKNKMNKAINDYIKPITPYDRFKVFYDEVGQKFWFGNSYDKFILTFDNKIIYDLPPCDQSNVWYQYNRWGLPSYLGFNKENYVATSSSNDITFDYRTDNVWLDASNNNVWYVEAPMLLDILGDSVMYMEMEKYNSYDELYPYPVATTNSYGNDYGGIVQSAFAKIPITSSPNRIIFDSVNAYLTNLTQFNPPLERIQKLKFKFRYHNGRPVHFSNTPLNFTIEINQLRNEILKQQNVRTPHLYPF